MIVVYDCYGEGLGDQNVDCTFVSVLPNISSDASYQYPGSSTKKI